MKFNIQNLTIIILLLVSFTVRVYNLEFPGILTSKWGDGFRDYLIADYIRSYGERPLLGPFNLLYDSGLRNSPIYYYLLAFFLIPKASMMILAYVNIFFQLLTIVLIYLLTKAVFDNRSALAAVVLFSFTPEILRQTEYIWQPTLMQPMALLSLYLLSLSYFRKNYKILITSLVTLSIAVALHNSIFSIVPLFLILSLLVVNFNHQSIKCYLGIILVFSLSILVLYLPVLVYFLNHQQVIINQPLISFSNYFANLSYNFSQILQAFSINWLLLLFLILAAGLFLRYEKGIKKYFFLIGILFFLQPILFSSLFNKNQLHYLIVSFGLFAILVSVSLSKIFKNLPLFIAVVLLLFKIFSDDFSFLNPPKVEAGNQRLISLAADSVKGQLQREDVKSFQIISYARQQTTFRYPTLDTILLFPLEKKLDLKLAKISDDSPYNLVQTNEDRLFFVSCFEFDHSSAVTDCSAAFLFDYPSYSIVKNIYLKYPLSIFLAKKNESTVDALSLPVTIKMTFAGFEPFEVSIDSDSTLIFENADKVDHWPASDIHPTHDIYPEFDPQKPIKPNESWTFKPTKGGRFKYHDHLNPHFRGILEILGGQSEPVVDKTSPDIKTEVDRIIKMGFLRLKNLKEDENSYIRFQMDYCFKNGGRDFCYKDLATILTYQYSLPDILSLLQKNENYQGVFARCHELTHYLTRLAYSRVRSISTIYDECTSVCHGGCYHGAIEQYLSDKKLSVEAKIEEEIPKVCGKNNDYKVPLLYDECVHGIGHGTMYINDGDLIKALNLCDKLHSRQDQESCYSGAFMENSSSSTNLDHPSKFINKNDPMYPCNSLDKKYLNMCYRYQSSYFAIITQSNWQEVAKLCQMVPKEYQKPCFLTVGSNQVGFTQDFKAIINDCNLMPNNGAKEDCFTGAVDALAIRYRGDFQKGVKFCSMVDPKFQPLCFGQYGNSISAWSNNPQDRIKLCDSIGNYQFTLWCKESQNEQPRVKNSLRNSLSNLANYLKRLIKPEKNIQQLTLNEQILSLKEMAHSQGVEKAWQNLKETFNKQPGMTGQIHDLAHLMGGLIYQVKGFEGMKICSPNFAFGCYHGFLDFAFASSLDNLGEAEKGCQLAGEVSSGPYASCIHGIGHGVASFYSASNLKAALAACEGVSQGKDFCYDGVFMEFSRNAPSSFYKADQPTFPCEEVDQKYIFACGRNQPAMLMGRFQFQFADIVRVCLDSDSKLFTDACFDSLGFSLASMMGPDQIIDRCRSIGEQEYIFRCTKAAAGELIFQNRAGWQKEAPKICDSLIDRQKTDCHDNLERLIKDYKMKD